MKYFLFLMFLPNICMAKEYHFVFDLQTRDRLEYKTDAPDWKTAFERASMFCGEFLMKKAPLDEDRILYITDVCANPREKK